MPNTQQIETVESLMKRKKIKEEELVMIVYTYDDNSIHPEIGVFHSHREKGVIGLESYTVLKPPIETASGKKIPSINHNPFYTMRIEDLAQESKEIYNQSEIASRLREDPVMSYYAPLFE